MIICAAMILQAPAIYPMMLCTGHAILYAFCWLIGIKCVTTTTVTMDDLPSWVKMKSQPTSLNTRVLAHIGTLALEGLERAWAIQCPLELKKMCSVTILTHISEWLQWIREQWASYQIRKIAGCVCAWNAGNVLPATAGWRSRHASWHVHDARSVMHAGIAN